MELVRKMPSKIADVHCYRTRDGITVSDAAANALEVARFRPGSKAICRCQAEEDCMNCDALYIMDSGGNHGATFHGPNYRAKAEDDGELCIYKAAGATHDNVMPHCRRLSGVNERNARFWQVSE